MRSAFAIYRQMNPDGLRLMILTNAVKMEHGEERSGGES